RHQPGRARRRRHAAATRPALRRRLPRRDDPRDPGLRAGAPPHAAPGDASRRDGGGGAGPDRVRAAPRRSGDNHRATHGARAIDPPRARPREEVHGMSVAPVYDRIGKGYAVTRRADPRIARMIRAALGDARRLLNVGAGTGSYEPDDMDVVAVEPSWEMIRQRRPGAAPVVRAAAERLPFASRAFDGAMAILTLHHWTDREAGVRELGRVAR